MKLKQLLEMSPSLQVLSATKLPAKTGYRIGKALNLIKGELAAYDEQRVKLAKELGTISEDGGHYEFTAENGKEFQAQIAELLEVECEIVIPTVTPDELGNAEIEPQHMAVLDGIVIKES